MLWIGLTGSLGTGKSTVARILRQKGHVVVDADEMARLALGPGTAALTKVLSRFGTQIFSPGGDLDRRALGRVVFADKKALADLEAIVHPEVKRLTAERRRQAENEGHALAFYDVPLLFEKSMQGDFDRVVVVTASPERQVERVMRRDGLTREEIGRRLANQIPQDEKARGADFVIANDGSERDLEVQVQKMIEKLQNPQE